MSDFLVGQFQHALSDNVLLYFSRAAGDGKRFGIQPVTGQSQFLFAVAVTRQPTP